LYIAVNSQCQQKRRTKKKTPVHYTLISTGTAHTMTEKLFKDFKKHFNGIGQFTDTITRIKHKITVLGPYYILQNRDDVP